MSRRFEDHTRVRVTFEGIVDEHSADDCATIRTDDDAYVYMEIKGDGLTVERLAPPEPIAVAGRVYRDTDGDVGLVRADDDGDLWIYWVTGGEGRLDDMPIYPKTLTQVWPPLDAEPDGEVNIGAHYRRLPPHLRKDASAGPLHTWPPTEPGLWYQDKDEQVWCSSIRDDGLVSLKHRARDGELHGGRADFPFVERTWGPMTPIPTPGGAS